MVPAALWMALTMLVSPEALPQEVDDDQTRLNLGLASHPIHGPSVHPPRAATSIPSTGFAGAASGEPARHGERLAGGGCSAAQASWAAKDETSSFGASDGPGKDAFGLGPVGQEAAGLPAHPLQGCQGPVITATRAILAALAGMSERLWPSPA